MITKQQVEGLIERLGGKITTDEGWFKCYIPITIGNVLDKMRESDFFIGGDGSVGEAELLICYWMPLGLSRSLQDIVNESGYRPEASELCAFILHLFPENNENK